MILQIVTFRSWPGVTVPDRPRVDNQIPSHVMKGPDVYLRPRSLDRSYTS